MRIGGEKVTTDNVVEVRYPYTDEDRHRSRRNSRACPQGV